MARLVPIELIPICLPGDAEKPEAERDTLYILPQMDQKTTQLVMADLVRLGDNEPLAYVFTRNIALLRRNIVHWSGPGFAGAPCTPENIDRLNPNEDDLPKLALDEIRKRNPVRRPDPKGASDVVPSSEVAPMPAPSALSESTTSPSDSRSASAGRATSSTSKTRSTSKS
jgi:hypothetical protein